MESYIPRTIETQLYESLKGPIRKVNILYGPRQVGKTSLSDKILHQLGNDKILRLNADAAPDSAVFSSRDPAQLRLMIGNNEFLFIDEAQRIPDIGINLKILHDQFPKLRILVTGSSSLDLANKVLEPLTGRTRTWWLYPMSAQELSSAFGTLNYHQRLEEWLLFGTYPEVVKTPGREDKISYLTELTNSYLFKDILELANIRNSNVLRNLLKMLSLQVGGEVSFNELGRKLGVSTLTIQRYIDLLEKSFVLKVVGGFSRNLRKEITKSQKIYFLDLGIRNALIDRFNPLSLRDDIGALWENFLFIERMKLFRNNQLRGNHYFWRLHTGAELDMVEHTENRISGFEFKFRSKKAKAPESWVKTYPEASFELINTENYLPFVLEPPKK